MACIPIGMHSMGVLLIGVHLIDVHVIGELISIVAITGIVVERVKRTCGMRWLKELIRLRLTRLFKLSRAYITPLVRLWWIIVVWEALS